MLRVLVLALVVVGSAAHAAKSIRVRGHATKRGTYVQSYRKTSPNKSRSDNYGSKGNVNPYTGKAGTK